ncbi:MAG: M48 family metalloprotease [Micropepsaceae bacterium]
MKAYSAIIKSAPSAAVAIFLVAVVSLWSLPAHAQGMSIIRDTETERVIRSYLDPLLITAGLNPYAVQLHIVNDPAINAFVGGGQHMFIHTGLITNLESANQLIGVLAHETGHIAGGHLIRTREGMRAASVPMLLSIAAGIGVALAGLPEAGMALIMSGQNAAMGSFFAFSRVQESIADQSAIRYLEATGQSGRGMLELFARFEGQEILSANRQPAYARSHPVPRDRIFRLENLVEMSPYADRKDPPEIEYAFQMLQAKLRGYTNHPNATLRQYPESDTSQPARYARAMAYFRQPNMARAFEEIESLLVDDPDNAYFLEMYGQINVEMGRVADGIAPYERAVELMPDAPQIRAAFGSALLSTGTAENVERARIELELALSRDKELWHGWYELAKAYNQLGLQGEAQLATAERYFTVGAYPQAVQFAYRAQQRLESGTRDWQRANDIMAVAQAQMPDNVRN